MRRLVCFLLLAACADAQTPPAGVSPADLPPEGVVFDDFAYPSTAWVRTFRPDNGGAPREIAPPSRSLFGINGWRTPDGEQPLRLWYRYQWQELEGTAPGAELRPTPEGVSFVLEPGRYTGGGCPAPGTDGPALFPQQISTGFAARRGTWATRVRLDSLGRTDLASIIQAFWLVSPASAVVSTPDGDLPAWNEIDHEFNNRFLGDDQPFDYSATGARGGDGTDIVVTDMHAGDASRDGAWSCREPGGTRALAPERCAALIVGEDGPAWTTLLLRVDDDATHFALRTRADGRTVEMRSAPNPLVPALPMTAVLSQHINPGGAGWTCAQTATVLTPKTMTADWFYYTPALADLDAVEGAVATLRADGGVRVATVPGLDIERPERPLPAVSATYGFASRTTPLHIEIDAPTSLRAGQTTRLIARPPNRHGKYRYTWTVTEQRDAGPPVTRRVEPGSFSVPYTLPPDARRAVFRVRLEELDGGLQPIDNRTVRPVERVFAVYRASASTPRR